MPPLTRKRLFYITHIDNLRSIFKHGILSHERRERDAVEHTPIYDAGIVAERGERATPDGRNLWSFANMYFQPRNAMLFRVTRYDRSPDEVVVLGIKPTVLNRKDVFITTGNAASDLSDILPAAEGRKRVNSILKASDKKYWNIEDGSKREMMAELLVPDAVDPDLIDAVYCASEEVQFKVQAVVPRDVNVIVEPDMFFRSQTKWLNHKLFLARGDLFFSRQQTLTISVNTVGVMGKGLASRAKYQFPDVYVEYQDACRKKWLKMGQPYLYKRESAYEMHMADDPASVPRNGDDETWFLLFATKSHWRENADLHGIEEGLDWLYRNYKLEGIKSLAVPALGCGLGKLPWAKVGPTMCKVLVEFDIQVFVYLPAEHGVDPETLTAEYLLG